MEAEITFYTEAYAAVSSLKTSIISSILQEQVVYFTLKIFASICVCIIKIPPLLDHESV